MLSLALLENMVSMILPNTFFPAFEWNLDNSKPAFKFQRCIPHWFCLSWVVHEEHRKFRNYKKLVLRNSCLWTKFCFVVFLWRTNHCFVFCPPPAPKKKTKKWFIRQKKLKKNLVQCKNFGQQFFIISNFRCPFRTTQVKAKCSK